MSNSRVLMAVLPLRDSVVYPHMVIRLFVGRDKSLRAFEKTVGTDNKILLVAQKDNTQEDPDVDDIYMQSVQAMSGHGGWPMTVFLTPEGKPFYGGTYFPPTPRYGMPSFPQLLEGIANFWRNRRGEVEKSVTEINQHLQLAFDPSEIAHPTKRFDHQLLK